MLKRSTLAALLMALTIFAGACGKSEPTGSGGTSGGGGAASGPDMATPQGALKALQDAFATLDPAKFEACYTAEAWKEGKMKKEIDEMKKEGMSISISFTDADIKVEGDKAVVATKMKFKMKDGKEEEESEKFHMVKVDGKWKFASK
ncbi:MAG: hypothetical protein FD180_4196 [Planctomycetota bacterium]|nr:MAG: hypothetical protein FD180_4196 [Planctomycetota bacterium]